MWEHEDGDFHEERGSDPAQRPELSVAHIPRPSANMEDNDVRPGFDMMKSDLASLIAEQQVKHESRMGELQMQHEKRLGALLEEQHRQILEAVRLEMAKAPIIPGNFPTTCSERSRWTPTSQDFLATDTVREAFTPVSETNTTNFPPPFKTSSSFRSASGNIMGFGERVMQSMQSGAEEVNFDIRKHEADVLAQSFNRAAGRLIQRAAFEYIVCSLVALNAVSIGVHAEWAMHNLTKWDEEPEMFRYLDRIFGLLFFLELVLRVAGEGWHFLAHGNRNRPWNLLDVILVVSVLVEEGLHFFLVSAPSVTIMRLLRTLRTVRVVRVFRVTHFFTDLRLLVMGLMCAARSIFWVIVLLLFVMYIFAVSLMEITADNIVGHNKALGENASIDDDIFKYIGSLDVTMYTLYKSVSGGLDWGVVSDELAARGPFLTFLFAVYIAFATLCILNIVTGVFVQNASTNAHNDQIEMGLEHLERRRLWLDEVIGLFRMGDVEGTGQISWDTFRRSVQKPSVQACFMKLGIDLETINPRGLFCLFDVNNSGTIDLDEFASGIMKLHGQARSFDLHMVGNNTMRVLHHMHTLVGRRSLGVAHSATQLEEVHSTRI